ncbi:hypothetical protein [Streptomyces sp. ITFR-16]|uniref:hypothetical protein n=1 Tax=Streptomyces sp. ITFR-16 TaxID=3075198 RepID=UPI00288C371E|nr:hypothetical protein [Streptomyces sp. ITFR-16]WNI23238.1 hypothetical protein RLT58_15455 [Streptomyces sp. ITFR-16]
MLWHVISPSYGYVKAAHHIVRHPKLGSDAKILITYVQGLPEKRASKALSDHAKALGITGRAYQRAKAQLKENGFVHEWRRQGEGGLWVTDQLFSNVGLTDEEARRIRDAGRGRGDQPSERSPTVGRPGGRSAGGYEPEVEEREKNSSHPPSEPPAAEPPAEPSAEPVPPDPEVAEAERVLLSLRHASPQLHLGVREARSLSGAAADWLRRGVKAAELRLALVSELPAEGVRSAVGFVRHRLVQKLPEEPAPVARAPEVRPYVPCEGEGPEHVFRPRADETVCRSCAQGAAEAAHWAKWPRSRPGDGFEEERDPLPWRERVAAILEQDAGRR